MTIMAGRISKYRHAGLLLGCCLCTDLRVKVCEHINGSIVYVLSPRHMQETEVTRLLLNDNYQVHMGQQWFGYEARVVRANSLYQRGSASCHVSLKSILKNTWLIVIWGCSGWLFWYIWQQRHSLRVDTTSPGILIISVTLSHHGSLVKKKKVLWVLRHNNTHNKHMRIYICTAEEVTWRIQILPWLLLIFPGLGLLFHTLPWLAGFCMNQFISRLKHKLGAQVLEMST